MWLADEVLGCFGKTQPTLSIELFRVLFAFACLMKFATETRRGYFEHFKPHTFLYFSYRLTAPLVRISERLYKGLYVAKVVAATLLLLGVGTTPALLVLIASFAVELRTYFKFHANLMLLVSCALLFAPEAQLSLARIVSSGFTSTWQQASAHHDVPFAQTLIVFTMSLVYVATAVRKLNAQFLEGSVVAGTLRTILRERGARHHSDGIYPAALARWVVGDRATIRRRFGPFMIAVVVFELALPPLLLGDIRGFLVGAFIGALMHLSFTLLFPATLAHFSLLTVSTYVLFVDPETVARLARWVG